MPYDEISEQFYIDETGADGTAEVRLKIDGIGVAPLTEAIVAKIAREREPQIRRLLDAAIEAKVKEIVDEVARARIADAVEGILREGFQQTNSYGSASGPKLTLQAMIVDQLTKRDNYSSRRDLPAIVADVIKGRFSEELDRAVAQIRAMVDGDIKLRLNEALRNALGQK